MKDRENMLRPGTVSTHTDTSERAVPCVRCGHYDCWKVLEEGAICGDRDECRLRVARCDAIEECARIADRVAQQLLVGSGHNTAKEIARLIREQA